MCAASQWLTDSWAQRQKMKLGGAAGTASTAQALGRQSNPGTAQLLAGSTPQPSCLSRPLTHVEDVQQAVLAKAGLVHAAGHQAVAPDVHVSFAYGTEGKRQTGGRGWSVGSLGRIAR